jgi:hypothetical protein
VVLNGDITPEPCPQWSKVHPTTFTWCAPGLTVTPDAATLRNAHPSTRLPCAVPSMMSPTPVAWLSPSKTMPLTVCPAFFSRAMSTAAPALTVAPRPVTTCAADCWISRVLVIRYVLSGPPKSTARFCARH